MSKDSSLSMAIRVSVQQAARERTVVQGARGEHAALVGALGGPGRGAGRGLVHVVVRGHVAADAQALAHGDRPQLDHLPLVALQTHLRRNQVKPFIPPGWEDEDTMPEQDPGSAHPACRAETICHKGEC